AATANGIQLQNSTLNINAATQDFTVTATGGEGGSGALGGSGGKLEEGSKLTNMTWGDLGGNAVAGGLDLQQTQGNLAVQKILVTATGGAGGVGGGKAGNATATALQADGSTLQVTAKTVQAVANGSTSGTMEILGVKIPLFTGDITNTTDAQGVVLANSTMTLTTDEVSATATGTDVAVGVRADSAKAQALVLDNASLQVSAFTEGGKIAIKAVAQDGAHGTVATKNATALDAKNNTSVVFNNAVDFTGEVKLDNSDVVLLGKGTTTVTDGNGAAANEAGSLSLANGSQLVSTDMLTITTGDLLVAGNSADPTQGSTVTLLNTGASTVGGDLTVKEQSTLQTSGDLTVTGDATLADSTLKLYNTNEVDGTLRSAEQYQAKADYNTLTVGGTLTTTGTNEVYLRTNANGVDIGYGRDQTTLASGVVAAGDKLVATTGATTAGATNNLHIFDQGMRNGYQNQLDANGVAQFDPNNQVTLVTGNNLAAGTTTVAAVQYDNTIFNYTYTPELANDGTSVKVTGVKVDKTALSNTPKAAQQSRAAMVALLTAENETIWQRAEELRGKTEANGVWGKYVGGKQRAETGFGDADTTYNGVQIGYDRAVGKDWNVGVAFSYLNGSADVFGGDTDLKSKALTVYGLYTDDKGHFFDAALKYGKVDNDFTTYGGTVAQATKGEYSSNAYAASLAYGYRQELKNSKWYVEPRVSLTMGQLGSEDFTVQTQDGLLRVNADGVNTTALRFGSTFGTKVAKDTDFYIKAALGHEFSGGVDTYMNADGRRVLLSDDLGGTFFEYGIGLKGKMGKNSRYYLDLGGATGSPNHKVYGLSAGMLYSF
ncbi:MAG: autotransporter outer membrane beta-barrel domain-containing protein, partial [Acidaminococcaceae bacterium]